ncbi:MAG TPA: hypothetical protein P5555_03355 [Candidatus Paceibacterota bacterium]|nr:hypothetical protein [Verrucomicrobiota bacterium]HRZ44208.1 hypothetical protein [Candidatus Paceibacterota bacterium]
MDSLPPIPTPAVQRWKEIRYHVLPIVVFGLAVSAVTILWRDYVSPPGFVGQVEPMMAQVVSPDTGVLTNLQVTLHAPVRAGQLVAEVDINARYRQDLARDQLQIMQMEMDPVLNRQRSMMDYQRLKMDLMAQEVDLATARINLERARNEWQRKHELHASQLITEDEYDLVTKVKEAASAEVDERARLVADLRATLEQLRPLGEVKTNESALDLQEYVQSVRTRRLQTAGVELDRIPLRSPIDGVVTSILRRSGETIVAGEPIITICATNAERIVSYLRHPLPARLEAGMAVEVRSRTTRPAAFRSIVQRVGAQLEMVSLALMTPGLTVEYGLPIWVELPADSGLRPGEMVYLELARAAN